MEKKRTTPDLSSRMESLNAKRKTSQFRQDWDAVFAHWIARGEETEPSKEQYETELREAIKQDKEIEACAAAHFAELRERFAA